mgnify:CR=1 FL=1
MRASVGFSASSGMIQRLPARCAPGMRSLLQRIPTLRGEIPHFSAASNVDRYFISANYLDQDGIIINSDYKRLSFRSNVEVDANKYLTLGLNLQTSYSERNDPDTDSSQGPISRSILVAPIVGLDQQTVKGGNYYLSLIHI